MSYYQERITPLENLRSQIKHAPESVDLDHVRELIGYVMQDLEFLAALKHPKSYKLKRGDDGFDTITVVLEADRDYAEELVRYLWTYPDQ